jgi:hypothetical protein
MTVKIGENVFGKYGIRAYLEDEAKQIKIEADLKYDSHKLFKKSLYAPSVMGPFSYVPFMQCRHGIISMRHNFSGFLIKNEEKTDCKGLGYIEKDSGACFPESYLWLNALGSEFSATLAVAKIPFLFLRFKGFICVLQAGGRQYNFSIYNFCGLKAAKHKDGALIITLKKRKSFIRFIIKPEEGLDLKAPYKKGEMSINIKESHNAYLSLYAKIKKEIIQYEGECSFEQCHIYG